MTHPTFAIGDTICQSHIDAVNDLTARIAELEAELHPRLATEALEDASYGFPPRQPEQHR